MKDDTPVQQQPTNSLPVDSTPTYSNPVSNPTGGYTPYTPITDTGLGTTPVSITTPDPITTPTTTVPTYVNYNPTPIVSGGDNYTPSPIVPDEDTTSFWPEPTYMDYNVHSGGEYKDGEFKPSGTLSNELLNAENLLELDEFDEVDDGNLLTEGSALDDIINTSKYTKVPTSTIPSNTQNKSKSSIIPIAAGLTVAAAAGLGAKAYLDHKNNNDMDDEDEEYEENFDSDDWYEDDSEGEDTVEVQYNDEKQQDDSDQEYYQDYESTYSAKSHDELADLE